LLLELAGDVTGLVFCTLLFMAFSQKRRLAPYLFVRLAAVYVLFGIFDFLLASMIPATAAKASANQLLWIGAKAIFLLVWIAYFMKSTRVKRTFVEFHPAQDWPPLQMKSPTEHPTPA